MRDLFLVASVFLGLIATFRWPFAGVLLWTWFTCMDPHEEAFGFAQSFQFNLIIVVVTLLAWLISREPKQLPLKLPVVMLALFFVWMTLNSFFAVDPNWSWPLWDRTWRIIILGIFVIMTATNKVRMHAIVWMVVLSLLFYGVKGGLYTVLTGGGGHVLGPDGTIIGDNNHLAVALAMMLPMANYLRRHTADRRISVALLAGMALSAIAIVGTYSRGGFVTLLGLAAVAWLRAKSRLVYPIAAAVVIVPVMMMMPQSYDQRMATIKTAQSDESFHGRLVAWQVAFDYATDHFPIGDGFSGAELPQVFNHYFPKEDTHAAHSVFFQVLGDLGFMGLAIYLVILVTTVINCSRIKALARGKPEFEWAYDMADMMQLSLFAFCLGGAALSLAYYDVFFLWVGLSTALRIYVVRSVPQERRRFGATPASQRSRFSRKQQVPAAPG